MIFNFKHKQTLLYNTLLSLSRNLYFYNELKLKDTFETRVYLMFFHFSVMMIIFKKKGSKFDQNSYDSFFQNIENNLREMGFGDVSVNKKMKDLNKILYDILLKIFIENDQNIQINEKLILKYFRDLDKDENNSNLLKIKSYFLEFYNFCFEQPLDNVIRDAIKFKKSYGST